jgi:hypothetical protein
MTPEQLLLAALTAVTSGLCFLFKLVWSRSDACEKWRAEKEPIINEMAQKLGLAEGVANIVNACKTKGCPFAGHLETSYSLNPKDNK